MARRRKRLVDLVRDGTFLARKDERLLASPDTLPWPELESYRQRFHATRDREIALELERELREHGAQEWLLGRLQDELRKLGPPGSVQQLLRFAPRFFRHQEGALAGKPYRFPPNHQAFLREFWRRDKHGRRLYQVGLLMEPKGCSKTPSAAILGTHALVSETDSPSVYQIAGAKDQANFGHAFVKANVEDGALAAWLEISGGAVECPEHRGEFEILSAEGDLSAGANPLAAIFDELFLFRHRHQREAWNSQAKALHKRSGRSFVLGISTAGWDKQTLLGEIYDQALNHPALDERDDGYHLIVRDPDSGFLFWCHRAPDGVDIENPDVIRAATPAPWIDVHDLLRELRRPDSDELDWRRLHLNQWTTAREAWLPSGVWQRLIADTQIPEGAEITVGIDAARSFDTTAIGWCWIDPQTGRKHLRSHVWSVRRGVPHHTLVAGGELVNEDLVEPFVAALAGRYRIRAIGFDERYFAAEARHLANEGFVVIEVKAQSGAMDDAVVLFEREARGGKLAHDGDRVLALHVGAVDAIRRPDGSKKIGKRAETNPIDAAIGVILAGYLPSLDLPDPEDDLGAIVINPRKLVVQ